MQFSALAKHEEAASTSSSGAITGNILSYENGIGQRDVSSQWCDRLMVC